MQKESELGFLQLFLNENIYIVKEGNIEDENVSSDLKYFGENKHQVTILINYKEDFLKTSDFDFLLKIMEAVKLTLNELSIVNLSENETINLSNLKENLKPQKIIFFDIPTSVLSINKKFENYSINDYEGVSVLLAENLSDIKSDVQKKRKLWTSLQELF